MKRHGLAAICLCAGLAGCVTAEQAAAVYGNQRPATPEERAQLVETLRKTLFDPYSVRDAEISNVLSPKAVIATSQNHRAICVRLNGKNRMGAYIGLQYMMFKYASSGALISVDDTPIAQQQCADNRLGYSAFGELTALN